MNPREKGFFERDTPLERAIREENERVGEREQELLKETPHGFKGTGEHGAEFAPTGADFESKDVAGNQRHQPLSEAAEKQAHISQKVYLFPESFNALRRELEEHYPHFFHTVNPDIGMSPAYAMVFDAPNFIGMCNGATDLSLQVDSGSVDYICKKFLNAFRELRGVGKIH